MRRDKPLNVLFLYDRQTSGAASFTAQYAPAGAPSRSPSSSTERAELRFGRHTQRYSTKMTISGGVSGHWPCLLCSHRGGNIYSQSCQQEGIFSVTLYFLHIIIVITGSYHHHSYEYDKAEMHARNVRLLLIMMRDLLIIMRDEWK